MPIDLESLNCSNGTTQLLWHLQRLSNFLKQHEVLWRAHLVDFFQERLWDKMNKEWLNTLKYVAIQDLLKLPLGVTQDNWSSSLQEFVETAHCLSLFRKPKIDNDMVVEPEPIKLLLSKGMNKKKRHEVEIIGAMIAHFSKKVKATHVVDVGAGQGYLAQVLCFRYNLPVLAIDCCSHHTEVTSKRAKHIQKHYKACSQKGPRTLTCHMGQMEMATCLPLLCSALSRNTSVLQDDNSLQAITANTANHFKSQQYSGKQRDAQSIVVAGLHACGDLSANMLRTFWDCKEVNAVISVGCCYNLLSEGHDCGFPLSEGVKNAGLVLDRNGRDLACQSAERWSSMGPEAAAQNFQVHSFRAAFQLVLQRYYPEIAATNPCVGRVGKARRRKQLCKALSSTMSSNMLLDTSGLQMDLSFVDEANLQKSVGQRDAVDKVVGCITVAGMEDQIMQTPSGGNSQESLVGFQEYARAALRRLSLPDVPEKELISIWEEIEPYTALVGVFWSLRAVLAPVLESYILLDRLLFLKEQALKTNNGDGERIISCLLPLFDPMVSPRNMAIIGLKCV